MRYLLDSNIFLSAHKQYYAIEIFPGFWDWLVDANDRGVVFSSERVYAELKPKDDSISDWAKPRGKKFFLPVDNSDINAMALVAKWTQSKSYKPAQIDEFLRVADSFLVAQAKARGMTLVTFEEPGKKPKDKIKIPDACAGVGVPCLRLYDLLKVDSPIFVHHRPVPLGASPTSLIVTSAAEEPGF